MALTRWRPMGGDLQRLEREFMQDMGRYFNEMRSWWEGGGELAEWTPSINMYEKDDHIVIEAETPGMKKEDIEVSVRDRVLTLSGHRKEEKETKEKDFYQRERSEGSFSRSITLPSSVDAETVEATYADGVLTLKVPKTEEEKGKRVEIH